MKGNGKICCIFNVIPHYRSSIVSLIDKELAVDIYAGNRVGVPLKLMDYSKLSSFKKELKYFQILKPVYLLFGSIRLSFKKYNVYLMTGEVNCLSTWIILAINRILGKRTYLWSHGYYGDEGRCKSLLKKIYFGLSAGVFLYGERARKIMINRGFVPEKLHVINNSLDYERQISLRSGLKHERIVQDLFGNDFPLLIFIGRLQKVKKIDLLIQSVADLKKEGLTVNLLIVGDGSQLEVLKGLVKKLGISDNVRFYGACFNEEESGRLLFNADACISPGNVGLTAIHSLTYGTPVITHNNFSNQMPEFEAIEKGTTGDFFKENSVDDLCGKIRTWTGLSMEEREKTRKNCMRVIDERYNPHMQLVILRKVLNSANV